MKNMANWDKLNQKFDEVLSSLSDADWENWAKNRESKKAMRKQQMLLKAKMQEEKLYFNSIKGSVILQENIDLGNIRQHEPEFATARISVKRGNVGALPYDALIKAGYLPVGDVLPKDAGTAGEYNYAMAA